LPKNCFANIFWQYFYANFLPVFGIPLLVLTKQSILDYLSNEYPNFRVKIQLKINRYEFSFWLPSNFREAKLLVALFFTVELQCDGKKLKCKI